MHHSNKIQALGGGVIIALIFSMNSCSLFNKIQAPVYNPTAYQAAVSVDSTLSEAYTGFANGSGLTYDSTLYNSVESIMNSKLSLDSTRKHPTQILSIDQTYIDMIKVAKNDHENDGNISTNHINVNGALLKQIGNILVTTEKNYKP